MYDITDDCIICTDIIK